MPAIVVGKHLFHFVQRFIHDRIQIRALICAKAAQRFHQYLPIIQRVNGYILRFIYVRVVAGVQRCAIIIVFIVYLIACCQPCPHRAMLVRARFQFIAALLWYSYRANGWHGLRRKHRMAAVALAYPRGRRVEAALKFVCFQHGRCRALVGKLPTVLARC